MSAAVPTRAEGPARPVVLVAFATAVVVATEFVVIGLVPAMSRGLEISLLEAGHLVSVFALGSAVLGPLLTIPAVRWQPRIVMAAALVPFALGNLAAAVLPGYGVVLATRLLQGAALPVLVSIGSAAVADLAGRGREGRAVAVVYIGVIAGTVIAIPAGTVLADAIDWRISFVLLGGLSLVAAWGLYSAFPRINAGPPAVMRNQISILYQPIVWAQLLLSALLFTAMFTPYTYLAALLESVPGLNATGIAGMLALFGLAGIPGNMIAGRLSDSRPSQMTSGIALILVMAWLALAYAGNGIAILLSLLAIWGAAHAAAFLSSQIRVMQSAPGAPAFAAALNISAANIGIAAGAAAGGAIIEQASVTATGIGGAALAVVAVLLASALRCMGVR